MNFIKAKCAVLFLCLCIPFLLSSQEFQGKAYYKSKTTVDMENFGRRDMPEDQKKRILERLKSMFEKEYVLTFNQVESVYKENEKLEAPGQRMMRFNMMSFMGGAQYKNIKNGQLLQEQELYGKQFLIKETLPKLTWEMSGETKQIGQYTCFKATTTKPVDELTFNNLRQRASNKQNDSVANTNEPPKQMEVTVWYTMQIPVSQGPADYWGLPGLILEVNADRTTILCSKIVMNPEKKEDIKIPTKGKVVNKEEYIDIVTDKIIEMREMYGRGRNSSGRRRN